MDTDDLATCLAALGQPTRLAAFRHLVRAGDSGLAVGALGTRLGLVPSTMTHHLAALIKAGLVVQERQGTRLICRADFARAQAVSGALLAECCADEGRG
ncbi:ArsR/SmtB family transcription factor [Lacimonas salitolerans]|uniref:ArsR/SmtB family transcription factor n=1 Tax=Lacimonas salitolerans TaxID=1323750 RepID=A0ABW4EA92_9RHOB